MTTSFRPDYHPDFYTKIFYQIENPALVITTDFTICDANEAAVEFLQYDDRKHLVGTDVGEILVSEDILSRVAEQIQRQNKWEDDVKIKTHDNRVYYGIGSAVPVESRSGEQVVVGLFSDLTERRRYLQSVKVMNRVLRHDLRNELTVMIGHLERLRPCIDEEHRPHFQEIYDMFENLVNRADKARELENVIRNVDTDTLTPVRLDTHLENALVATEHRYDDIRLEYPEDVAAVEVIGDEVVEKLFEEVLDNAVEHNDAEPPRVEVSVKVLEESIVVRVADNGPGVRAEYSNRIFGREEFDDVHHGTGFGLFFVDQVVQMYGGEVWVEESDLGGAAFSLQFPVPEAE